ncbi:hypothetical protein Ndes2526B_g08766 [Nannochloris sp. 'desiccata']|nr:hypothetical protein KSW81_001663 [Chlorella desiccata (nom. nud.)]KAH7616671.1 putative AP2-like ethylene-responsive transcription factor AIL7 [Chlorella desiccata (nom. nud.)]
MARTERGAAEGGLASEMTSKGATAAVAPPHCQPSSQPVSHLNDVLDTFLKDGMTFNTTMADPNPAQEARPPSINSPTSGSLQHLSNEELNRLLNFDGSFDLEMPLPDIFGDGDGNELLTLEFPGLNAVQTAAFRNNTSSSREVHQQQHRQHDHRRPSSTAGGNGAAPSEVDAARSVLASLQANNAGSPGPGNSGADNGGGGGATHAPSGTTAPPSHHPSYCTSPSQMQQHQMMAPPHRQQYQQQQAFFPGPMNNHHHGGGGGSNGMPLSMPQHGIPVYVDSRTGQILHVSSASSPPPHGHGHHNQQWQQMQGPAPGYFPPNGAAGPAGQPQWSNQYHSGMQQQHHGQQQQYSAGMEGLSGSMGPPPPMPHMMAPPHPQHQSMHFMDPHNMHHSTMMMHSGLPSPMDNPPSPRKMPAKRKRGSKVTASTNETMSQRTAKAEQGYTFDPVTGKMYRHGPALEATARDNRELPIVKDIFGSFQQHNYFAGVPPQGFGISNNTIQQQQQQQQQPSMPLPLPQQVADGSMYNMQMQLQRLPPLPNQFNPPSRPPSSQTATMQAAPAIQRTQQQPLAGAAPSAPPPGHSTSTGDVHPNGQGQSLSTSSSMPEHVAQVAPGGRQLNAATGHGLITSLVTKELQSSTPPPPPALGTTNSAGDGNCNGGDGGSIGSPPQMLGVKRDAWSLFFDAFVVPPPAAIQQQEQHQQDGELPLGNGADGIDPLNGNTAGLSGVIDSSSPGGLEAGGDGSDGGAGSHQQGQCIFLGKFPTRDQAGRAHDIAALKLYGESATTNFPKETYANTIPVLKMHSDADVVAALKKDSALALQRTSKYKGVRRTGQGQYEARADFAVVNAGLDQNAMAAAAAEAARAGPSGVYVPSPQGY